ncbi:MAG: hypothetical protein M1308_12110, partial [Actinobacteria bacterium]|nr:hypothetical protein [Actinomycetota bacterium]
MKYKRRPLLNIILVLLILLLVVVSIFMLYLAESRFFLIGKILYPMYVTVNNIAGSFEWPKKPDENITDSEIKKTDSTGNSISDTIVYCDYYTWHNYEHWQRGHSNEPALGFYDSLDKDVIKQHIDWAKEFGIDVFKIEYIPQFDESIKRGILKANLGDSRLCLMYDCRLRFESIGYKNPPYNFDDDVIARTFLDDMEHIAEDYFTSGNYFKIDGRPVLWIYVARDFTGRYKEVMEQARKNFAEKGYDVYLVGDIVFWNYKLDSIDAFDAVSCYSAYGGRPSHTGDFTERLKLLYIVWKSASGLQNKDFIPSGIPAYNDACLSSERDCITPLEGSAEEFKYELGVISNFLD